MVCDTRISEDAQPVQFRAMKEALDRLQRALADGSVTAVIGPSGAVTFKGWADRRGYSDACAFRKLSARNAPELRRAIARAEVTAGRKIDPRAVSAGVHSHDGGKTWDAGH